MSFFGPRDFEYSKAERISDAAVHFAALFAALLAVPVLVTLAAKWLGVSWGLLSIAIYGLTLIAMISCSLLYNHMPHPDLQKLFMRMDHSAIYLKIAGTYTPFAALSGGAGMGMLAGIWGAAVAGTSLTWLLPNRAFVFGVPLCLAMGWAVVIGGGDLLALLSPSVFALMVGGGVIYTAGTVFLLAQKMQFHATIWHVFVMVASVAFFAAVTTHLVQTTPANPRALALAAETSVVE
ncbi:MAG: hemolysin III family protein [Mangrovicoccus sp.]|nr:hemolysin III family protein [Mangrovicoccus sp.]